MKDFPVRREKMVAEQLAARGIRDERVLRAFRTVPRHRFVPEPLWDRAYKDNALPIGEGQTISQPFIVARTVEALILTGTEKILEIGVGSGYAAAILAECGKKVFGIERIAALGQRARATLEDLGYTNILISIADGTYGWSEHAPFEAIAAAAAGPEIPQTWLTQMAVGGRLVAPVGGADGQVLRRIVRRGETDYVTEDLDLVRFVPLIGRYGHQK